MGKPRDEWLESQQHKQAVDERAKSMMAPGEDFDPLEGANLATAIAGGDDANDNFAAIGKLIRAGKGDEVAKLMLETSTTYWLPRAQAQASVCLDEEAAQRLRDDKESTGYSKWLDAQEAA
jgi:hypothetical protein